MSVRSNGDAGPPEGAAFSEPERPFNGRKKVENNPRRETLIGAHSTRHCPFVAMRMIAPTTRGLGAAPPLRYARRNLRHRVNASPTSPVPFPSPPRPGLVPIHEIFPPGAYGFRLKLARAHPPDFFGTWDTAGELLRERHHWMRADPPRHLFFRPEAAPLLDETLALARDGWSDPLIASDAAPAASNPVPSIPPPLLQLSASLEPDLLFLARSPDGPRLVAGAVCFPSSWAPEEKVGLTVSEIHDVVPNLNAELSRSIDTFLDRLRPGTAWMRANWGLSASPELNQHPLRGLPRFRAPFDPTSAWLRIEHQALLSLPASGGILFGIRLEVVPFRSVIAHRETATGLAEGLRSMPEAMARYKGIDAIRHAAAAWLEDDLNRPGSAH